MKPWRFWNTTKECACLEVQIKLFSSTKTDSVICAKFQAISWQFANFQKIRHIFESRKKFESQMNSSKLSQIYFQRPKLSSFIKEEPYDDVSNDLIQANTQTLHTLKHTNSNLLLFLEALYIKYRKPVLNIGLKASKELVVFS